MAGGPEAGKKAESLIRFALDLAPDTPPELERLMQTADSVGRCNTPF